jgi:hypothetical protein
VLFESLDIKQIALFCFSPIINLFPCFEKGRKITFYFKLFRLYFRIMHQFVYFFRYNKSIVIVIVISLWKIVSSDFKKLSKKSKISIFYISVFCKTSPNLLCLRYPKPILFGEGGYFISYPLNREQRSINFLNNS